MPRRMTSATDRTLRELAKRLAGQLFLDLAREHRADDRGIGKIASRPYRPEGDVDLDASLEPLLDARARGEAVDVESLRVTTWAAPSTAWCLLVDRSGSMSTCRICQACRAG